MAGNPLEDVEVSVELWVSKASQFLVLCHQSIKQAYHINSVRQEDEPSSYNDKI